MSSRDATAAANVELADARIRRRQGDGVSFTNLGAALGWYFAMRERLQGPHAIHPRGEQTASGETVILDVDGGRGGDLDDVLATVSTIGNALELLHREKDFPRAYHVIVAHHRDGVSVRKQADRGGVHHLTLGRELARGEAYLVALLREAGVLR